MKPEEIEKKAKEVALISSEVIGYATKFWYRIMADTKLHLAKGGKLKSKPAWMVMNGKADVIASGSFEKCVDIIVDIWLELMTSRLSKVGGKIGKNRTTFNPFDKPIKRKTVKRKK